MKPKKFIDMINCFNALKINFNVNNLLSENIKT